MKIKIFPSVKYFVLEICLICMWPICIAFILNVFSAGSIESALDFVMYLFAFLLVLLLMFPMVIGGAYLYFLACRRVTITDDKITQGKVKKIVLQGREIVDYGIRPLMPNDKRLVVYVSNVEWAETAKDYVARIWELCAFYKRFPRLYERSKENKNPYKSEEALLKCDRPVVIWWRYSDETYKAVEQMAKLREESQD